GRDLVDVVAAVGTDRQAVLTRRDPLGAILHLAVDEPSHPDREAAVVVRYDLDVLGLVGPDPAVLRAYPPAARSVLDRGTEPEVLTRQQPRRLEPLDVTRVGSTLEHGGDGDRLAVQLLFQPGAAGAETPADGLSLVRGELGRRPLPRVVQSADAA